MWAIRSRYILNSLRGVYFMVSTLHSSLSIIYSFNLCSDSRYSSQKHYLMAFGLVWFINNFKDK